MEVKENKKIADEKAVLQTVPKSTLILFLHWFLFSNNYVFSSCVLFHLFSYFTFHYKLNTKHLIYTIKHVKY